MIKKSTGNRVLLDYGLISNILCGLDLIGVVLISNVTSRTYRTTVPWNVQQIHRKTFQSAPKKFNEISYDQTCKRTNTDITIEGELGFFVGPVKNVTDEPCGFGFFVTKEKWIHYGKVENGRFSDGKKISVNFERKKAIFFENRKAMISITKTTQGGARLQ